MAVPGMEVRATAKSKASGAERGGSLRSLRQSSRREARMAKVPASRRHFIVKYPDGQE